MTPDAEKLLEKADHALRVVKELLAKDFYADAVSKAYYAMFYAAQAWLLDSGIKRVKHSAVISALGQYFAKTGKLEPKYHQMIIQAQQDREIAYYDIYKIITQKLAEKRQIEATEFVAEIKKHLWFNKDKSDLVDEAEENVVFFNNTKKQEREQLACKAFLRCLGENFSADELKLSEEEPPDVIFRSARFEVMEILDDNRKRHDEFKNKVAQYNQAKSIADVMESYHAPTSISYEDLVSLIIQELQKKVDKYRERKIDCAQLDALVYINLENKYLDINEQPPRLSNDLNKNLKSQAWRSVSMVMGVHSHVIYALESAPKFIYSSVGQIRSKCLIENIWKC